MISVIMSVYNGSRFLRESIESILHQTYQDFEFIIIDDASTDDSESIILSYDDPRIVFIKNERNHGLTYNLIKAVSIANGQYIARMDSDDVAMNDRLMKQIHFMENNPEIDICGTWATVIDERGKKKYTIKIPVTNHDIKERLVYENFIIHPSVIIRKTVFEKHIYDINFRTCQDYKLWCDCMNDCNFANICECLIKYRINNNGVSRVERNNPEIRYKSLKAIYEKNLARRFPTLTKNQVVIFAKMISCLFKFDDINEIYGIYKVIKNIYRKLEMTERKIILRKFYNSISWKKLQLDFFPIYILGSLMDMSYKLDLLT